MTAGKTQASSFLPTIKCSDCNAEIQISMMGDHMCSDGLQRATPTEPKSQSRTAPFASSKPTLAENSTLSRSGRLPPPRIDPSIANRPFLEPAQLTPSSISSVSPIMQSFNHKSSRRMPSRSATAPLPRGPPSPELSNLDCAFPPFPTSKSRSATPTRDLDSKHPRGNNNEYVRMHAEPSPLYAPLSPRRNGGGNVLQRMNTIAPGPFDIGPRGRRDENQGPKDGKQHKKTATVTSVKDLVRPPSAGSGKHNLPRPSTAGSGNSRKPSLASISGGPRSMLDREEQTSSFQIPLPRPVRPDGYADPASPREHSQQEPLSQPLRLETRHQTFPINIPHQGHVHERLGPVPQRLLEQPQAPRSRRPTVSARSKPSLDGNSVHSQYVSDRTSSREPSSQPHGDAAGIHTRSTSRDPAKFDYRLNDATSVPNTNLAKDFSSRSSYHTPTESVSSRGSYGSDSKSGSSRSSPPLSDASTRSRTKPSNIGQVEDSRNGFQSSMDSLPPNEIHAPRSNEAPRSVSNPIQLRPRELQAPLDSKTEPPESPMDPAMQSGRLTPFPLSDRHVPIPVPNKRPDLAPPPARRATTANKGNCRGCGELIKGKSVSSADGRLTGRYHKQCFVCKTCKKPFQTADFYVINNHPYCERHYHQLNGSLCRACDRGIEGQYLATESKQKFHPNCFTCQDCRTILKDDYFEMNGKVYCERHAFRAAQQMTFLGPGRKNPERRTTRLMIM